MVCVKKNGRVKIHGGYEHICKLFWTLRKKVLHNILSYFKILILYKFDFSFLLFSLLAFIFKYIQRGRTKRHTIKHTILILASSFCVVHFRSILTGKNTYYTQSVTSDKSVLQLFHFTKNNNFFFKYIQRGRARRHTIKQTILILASSFCVVHFRSIFNW